MARNTMAMEKPPFFNQSTTLHELMVIDKPTKKTAPPETKKLEVLPGSGVEFFELTYSVTQKQKIGGEVKEKQLKLLHEITGQALSGRLTAVLGPSGAGKSTFLDALAGRIAQGSLGGSVGVHGRQITASTMKRISAYVMQDDQLFPMLTVYETFIFASEVRFPATVSRIEKRNRVEELIKQLGLQDAAHTRIGNEKHRGISGGEKRRVSIGVDIIHGPAVLFLDEPTSGLDSTSAFGVVERLKDIASDGSVVILTIHQPSRRIQQLLDKLIVLAKGKLIYSGSPDALPKHLATFGRSVPDGEDPVEYLLDVIKEYDLSDLGLNPLVQFQKDGIRPPVDQTPKLRTPKYGIRTPTRASQTPQAKKSPLFQLWTPLGRMHGAEDKSATDISVMAVMDGEDEFEDGYDHSLPSSPRFGRTSNVGNKTPIVEIFQTISPFFTADTNRSMWKPGQEKPSWTPVDPRRASAWSTTFAIKNNPSDLKSPAANPLQRDPEIDFSISQTSALSEELVEKDYGPKYANPWLRETAVLMWRNFFNIMRTPELFLVRTVVFVILGTLMSTLFKKFDKSLDGVSKTLNFLSYTLAVFFFSSNDAVPTFIQEKFIFIRETSHYSYRASSYVLANFIVYLPFLATQALAFDLITYLVLHLQTNFVTYWIICSACMITTNSFVIFISSIAPNYIMGYSVVIAFSALFFLTSGFFLKRLDMPPYWIWVHYLSTMKYPYEALLRSEFEHDHHCYAEGVVAVQPGPLGQVKFTDRSPFSNCTVQGVDILHTMDITHEQLNLVSDVAMLLAWGVFYRFLFYFVLRFYCKNQRD